MIRPVVICLCLLNLAACGTDGEPQQPAPTDGQPGVRVSGDARVGISVGDSGTRSYGALTLNNGPLSITTGF